MKMSNGKVGMAVDHLRAAFEGSTVTLLSHAAIVVFLFRR